MNSDRISMLQIDYFTAVATHKSFSEAAKNLYVSQPSLSKQVAQLERTVGAQLFKRSSTGVSFTPAGSVLFDELTTVKRQIKEAIDKTRKMEQGTSAVINIGCLEAMDTDVFLPQKLNELRNSSKCVDISLERHSFKNLREKLINGSLDIIFTFAFEIDDDQSISSKVVASSSLCIVMPESHPLARKKKLTMNDIDKEKFVMINREESRRGWDHFIGTCHKFGFSPNIVREAPNPESLILNVKSDVGITCLDSFVCLKNKKGLKLFEIPNETLNIVMAWRADYQFNPDILK